ncbi:MAG: tetratricopeptide repeat protein [Myxococcales bacterium]|nr:tetratricopeptide repeat protein [Myxococcales bacterium]
MSPTDETVLERREAPGLSGDVSLAETLESTGDGALVEHGVLGQGSLDSSGMEATEVAQTLAAGSAAEQLAKGEVNHLESGISAEAAIHPGERLGRLEIGKTLGSGAFGVVVAAYDPELKRKLAVKILRPEVFDSTGGKDAQRRLLREARAMARISHPNVVTVHDIGTVDGQVFVAMEFVSGTHLRHWLTSKKRTWQEIVDTFAQAGRGLSAAHKEGLVHRDFKPDNVLVSDTGDVRVADFGLVSISSQKRETIASAEFVVPRSNSDELGITRVGAVMGTALYMAPEQHLGFDAGPSADQFSFCVALYWALYKEAPFASSSYDELRGDVLGGKLLPPPSESSSPKWLWSILKHGLATDPASRFESMEALLAELTKDRAGRRKSRLRYLGLALAGAGAFGAFYMTRSNAGAVCQNVSERLDGTWDAKAEERISDAFTQAGRPGDYARLQGAVDMYTSNWVSVRTRVCEATHFVGDQSDSLMDLRMSCLDQRLGYLGELMGQLDAGAKGLLLDKAVMAAVRLPSLDACTQSARVESGMALPDDVAVRGAIEGMRDAVDKAQALFDLGKPADAAAVLRLALEQPVDFPLVMGDATHLLGIALSDMGELDEGEEMLHKSIEYATVAEDDRSVASSWLALMHLIGVERESYKAGHEMGRLAKLALARGKAEPLALAGVDRATAMILMREGKTAEAAELLLPLLPIYEESAEKAELAYLLSALGDAKAGDAKYKDAVSNYRLSLAHLESVLGPEHLENVYILNNLAVALKNSGDIGDARAVLERSLAIVERTYGPVHRNAVTILINLGNLARREGDTAEAKTIFARAISIGNEVLDPGHPNISKAIMNLGIVLAAEGDYEGATGRFLEVLERAKESFDGDHPDIAMALNNVGESLSLEGKSADGLVYVIEAMEMKSRLYGALHPKSASSIATVGTIYAKLGRVSEAETHLMRALAIFIEAAGETHPRSIKMLSELGRLHLAHGSAKKAIPFLRRAIKSRGELATKEQGSDRLHLAQALWANSERKAAATEVAAVRAILEQVDDGKSLRADFKQWLDER